MASKKSASQRGNQINFTDQKRMPQVRNCFAKRGLSYLNLAAMLRIVIDEWVVHQK